MNWLDVVILSILLLAAYKGMGVGLIGTAVIAFAGFIGWMLAGQLADDLGGYFEKLSNDTLVTTISYVAIIATAIAIGTIVSKFVKPLLTIATLGLSGIIDKVGGVALGLAFGIAITGALIIALARFTYDFEIPEQGLSSIVAAKIPVSDTKTFTESALTNSSLVVIFIDSVDSLPGNAFGFVPSDFKASLDILKDNIPEEK
tara:strand:+ start:4679 stop:5284 length:606 start_codon:yes stop_codon:yes gene_type:complete